MAEYEEMVQRDNAKYHKNDKSLYNTIYVTTADGK